MKWTHAPSGDGIPTPDALSNVQTPSDWYTQELTQGIQFMRQPPVSDRFGNSMPVTPDFITASPATWERPTY